jgi:hypothetical protein
MGRALDKIVLVTIRRRPKDGKPEMQRFEKGVDLLREVVGIARWM